MYSLLVSFRFILLLTNTYFFRYIVTGIIVTFYSLVVFYLLGSFAFLAVYFFVELSSAILKAYGYHYYVYNTCISSDLNHFLLIKKCFLGIVPVLALNILFILMFPLSLFPSILRAVFISVFVGFWLSKKVFLARDT